MNLRRKLLAFLQSQKKSVEYTELEWIGNEENCYIFFPLVTAGKDIVELEYEAQFTRTDVQQAEGKNGDPYFFIGLMPNSVWYAGCGYYGNSTVKADTEWHNFRLVSCGDDNGFWLDGTRIYKSDQRDGVYLPQGFRLWIGQNGSRTTYNRKKYVKVKVNGKLVYDLIPVLDKDLVPCMYDKLTGKYFYNDGDGEFTWKLPNQLEYLESTGTQYIDTEVVGTENTSIETGFEFTTTDVQYLFGSSVTYNTDTFCFSLNPANTGKIYRVFIGASTGTYGNVGEAFSTKMSVNNAYFSTTKIRLDDEVYDFTSVTPFTTPTPMYLFAKSNNGTADYFAKVKVKFFKIYDNGVLVQYLIPAFDEDLTVCMYDLVSRKYFYNQGSGLFKGYFEDGSQLVSYLTATGTQWIDTGIIPLIGDELELKNVQCKKKSSGMQAVFSAGTGNYQLIILVADGMYSDRASFFKYFASGGAKNINPPNYLNDPTKIKIDSEGNVFYNDVFIIQSPPEKETDSTLRLFYRANDSQPMTGNIGAVNIKRNDEFVINLVPVLKSDNTACMFDLVSKKYFVNAGSGSFDYGG